MHGKLQSLIAKGVNLAGDKGERQVKVLIDTGASRSMVRASLAALLGTPGKLAQPITLTIGDNSEIVIDQAVTLSLDMGGRQLTDSFLIFENLIEEAILGVGTMKKYGLKIDLGSQAIYAEIKEETSMQDFIKRLLAAIGITSVKDDVTEDDAIKMVKDKVGGAERKDEPAMSAPLLALIDLAPGASESQVRGALLALKTPGNVVPLSEYDALQKKCTALEIDAAVMAALSEGKLTPAEKDGWHKDLHDGKEKLDTFLAFTKRRGKVVPLGDKLPAKTDDNKAAAVDDAQAAVNRQLGVSPEIFAKYGEAAS